MSSAAGSLPKPLLSDALVRWRYVGAHTLHTWENLEACDTAAASTAGVTSADVLDVAADAVTVGYT